MLHARGLLLVLAACSSPSAGVQVTTGGETDALTKAPAVDSVLVEEVPQGGTPTTLAQVTLPQTNIDLGNPPKGDIASIRVTGFAHGAPVVSGATPFVELGALDGITIPLFVQREGECARMPQAAADDRAAPLLLSVTSGVLMAGGSLSDGGTPIVDAYNLLLLEDSPQLGSFSDVRSFAIQPLAQTNSDGANAYAWLIHQNTADVIELLPNPAEFGDGGQQPTVCSTSGKCTIVFTWSEVSGGATVVGADGNPYIIGATRTTGGPSQRVAQLPSDGLLHPATTSFRQGAAVAATSQGIVVYGGNVNATDPGAEVINADLTLNKIGAYPADATQGLAATVFNPSGGGLVLVSPTPRDVTRRMRLLDLQCSGCASLAPWGPAGIPLLSPQSLFAMGSGVFLLVGDDTSGVTHVIRVDASSVTELPLKIARHGARAIQIATGPVIIVGGGSSTLESCLP